MAEMIGPPDDGSLSPETDAEKESKISWRALLRVEENNLGFRHTYDDMLPEETEKGFRGDSLAICNVSEIVPAEIIPEEVSRLAEQFGVKPSLKQLDRYLEDTQKDQICELFSQEIKNFIQSSLIWGRLGEEPNLEGVSEFLNNLDASFVIIKYKLRPSGRDKGDDSNLGSLGKAGVESITPEMIFASISSQEYLDKDSREAKRFLLGEDEEMDQEIFKGRVLPYIVNLVYKKTIELINVE